MVLKQIGQLAAGRPHLADVRLQLQQLLLDRFQLLVAQVVKLRWIGLVDSPAPAPPCTPSTDRPTPKSCRGTSDPKTHSSCPAAAENRGVINQRVRPPHERHAINLALHAHQGQGSELRRKLAVARKLRKIERRRQSRRRNRSRHIARRRDHVIVARAAAAQLGHQFVARSHVGR